MIGEKWIEKSHFRDLNDLVFSLQKNGGVVQEGRTSHMLWKIDEIIEYISQYFTLKIGDVIFTGTPAGVGPVAINDELSGFIEDQQIFSIHVK